MIHYLKADLYKVYKERKLTISLTILLLLSLFSAFLFHGNNSVDYSSTLIQLLSQFITLFFIVPTNIFFGEDFSHRTINNIMIKQQQRRKIFVYKVSATVSLNLIYVAFAYTSSSLFRVILGGEIDSSLIYGIFVHQLPLFLCISLLFILLFIMLSRVNQAYLAYILISLLFDNIVRLIGTNIVKLELSTEYFLFLFLQNAEIISTLTLFISFIFSLVYFIFSYSIFNKKELN